MLVFDDARILDDIKIQILRQLNPAQISDRYVLYHCLFLSRRHFKLVASRLWSFKSLSVDNKENGACKFLLDHVRTFDPPICSDDGPTCGVDWRLSVYLRSIRRLFCADLNDPTCVQPHRLLPWLTRLDWVHAISAGEVWARALAERLSLPGQRPRHLSLALGLSGGLLMSKLGCKVPCLQLVTTGSEDGEMSKLVSCLTNERDQHGVESLGFGAMEGSIDLEAMGECLIAQGATLRRVQIFSKDLPAFFTSETIARVAGSVNRLTQLHMQFDNDAACELTRGILTACKDTLVDVKLMVPEMEILESVPMKQLNRLESLELFSAGRLDATNTPQWLQTMTSITRFTLSSMEYHLDGLVALMNVINNMRWLRELSIRLRECVPSTMEDDDILEVQLRLMHLRKVDLYWNQGHGFGRFSVLDWEDIEALGLPSLEGIHLHLMNVDPSCTGKEGHWTLPRVLYNAIINEQRTPLLASAKVHFIEVGFSAKTFRFSLAGGRSRFDSNEYERMRLQLARIEEPLNRTQSEGRRILINVGLVVDLIPCADIID
ncbi:hypothetical protein HK101_008344 [Irineochytrium annulatum]|nr:hypothetical protein HK101_008344 [Irineochytrium annulatum]